jgi:acyl carrier protein
MDKEIAVSLLKKGISEILEMDADQIDENEEFLSLGISSFEAVRLMNMLKDEFTKYNNGEELDIDPAAIFEYQTIAELAEHLITLIHK